MCHHPFPGAAFPRQADCRRPLRVEPADFQKHTRTHSCTETHSLPPLPLCLSLSLSFSLSLSLSLSLSSSSHYASAARFAAQAYFDLLQGAGRMQNTHTESVCVCVCVLVAFVPPLQDYSAAVRAIRRAKTSICLRKATCTGVCCMSRCVTSLPAPPYEFASACVLRRILGLPRSAKADDIKRAYRKRFSEATCAT